MQTTKRFTLIELLLVMAVIAMLAGLIMPAIGFVQRSAQKTKTRSQISALYLAVKQYESIYGALPLDVSSGAVTVDTGKYKLLIKYLCPKTTENTLGNTRGISFLVPNDGDTANPGFIDMWKQDLKVIMTSSATIAKGTGSLVDTVYSNVAIWSTGPNKRDDYGSTTTPGDDITSWK